MPLAPNTNNGRDDVGSTSVDSDCTLGNVTMCRIQKQAILFWMDCVLTFVRWWDVHLHPLNHHHQHAQQQQPQHGDNEFYLDIYWTLLGLVVCMSVARITFRSISLNKQASAAAIATDTDKISDSTQNSILLPLFIPSTSS